MLICLHLEIKTLILLLLGSIKFDSNVGITPCNTEYDVVAPNVTAFISEKSSSLGTYNESNVLDSDQGSEINFT